MHQKKNGTQPHLPEDRKELRPLGTAPQDSLLELFQEECTSICIWPVPAIAPGRKP